MAKIEKDQDQDPASLPVQGRWLTNMIINGRLVKAGWPVELPKCLADVYSENGYLDTDSEALVYALSEHALVVIDV
jgi:hypothetical protein